MNRIQYFNVFLYNEIYWYTREAAPSFGRKFGISYGRIVIALKKAEGLSKSEVYRLSEPFWPQFAHPLLVIKEVMGS